jgi:uncharacterized damage-inducible protein DinB
MNERHARNRRPVRATATVLVSGLMLAGPAAAQQHEHHHHDMAMPTEGIRAEMIQDLEGVEQRYLALAEAMEAHYTWRPGEGVRSTSEVFMHLAGGNFMIPAMAGVSPPEGMTRETVGAMQSETDPLAVREALEHSFRHLKHAIAMTPDEALDDPATLFGRETTKRAVFLLLVSHAHEHLGQSIAYARTNGVTPPWSGAN